MVSFIVQNLEVPGQAFLIVVNKRRLFITVSWQYLEHTKLSSPIVLDPSLTTSYNRH